MWVFFREGFISVVQKPGHKKLCVRARAAVDLDNFRRLYCPSLGPTTTAKWTDYPVRAYVYRKALARAMQRVVKAIVYDNFKSAVSKTLGYERFSILHSVWAAAQRISDIGKKKETSYGYPWWDRTEPAKDRTLFDSVHSLPPAKPRGWEDGKLTVKNSHSSCKRSPDGMHFYSSKGRCRFCDATEYVKVECKFSPSGKHVFSPDTDFDPSGQYISCEYCGEEGDVLDTTVDDRDVPLAEDLADDRHEAEWVKRLKDKK